MHMLIEEVPKYIGWQEPNRWFATQISQLRRNEALTNDLRELIQEHFQNLQERTTSLQERGAFLDGGFHLMVAVLLVQIEITNPLAGKTQLPILADWKKHLEIISIAKGFFGTSLVEWASIIGRLADSTPHLVFGFISLLLKLRERTSSASFSPVLLRSLLKEFYLLPLSSEDLGKISQQLSVFYGLGAWANDVLAYREWFRLLCESLVRKRGVGLQDDETVLNKASSLLFVLVKLMITGPGVHPDLIEDNFLHRTAINVLSAQKENDPSIGYENFLKYVFLLLLLLLLLLPHTCTLCSFLLLFVYLFSLLFLSSLL
jgi:hypothetical protein